MSVPKPTLYLLGIPLDGDVGGLEKTKSILENSDIIFGEEPRVASTFLKKWGVTKPFLTWNEHTTKEEKEEYFAKIDSANQVSFFSDIGMPCIEDPGTELVDYFHLRGYTLRSLPGPTALTTAIALCGYKSSPFTFLGFPPRETRERKEFLKKILRKEELLVFYETPYRYKQLVETLRECGFRGELFLGLNLGTSEEMVFRKPIEKLIQEFPKLPKCPPVIILPPRKL